MRGLIRHLKRLRKSNEDEVELQLKAEKEKNKTLEQELQIPEKLYGVYTSEELYQTLADYLQKSPNRDSALNYLKVHLRRFIETFNLLGKGNHGQRLLDLGSCEFSQIILRKFTSYEVTGTAYGRDYKIKKLHLTNSYGENFTAQFILFDMEREPFPFPDQSFDLVLFSEVLEHLTEDPCFTMFEINRVLKAEGRLILTTPNITRLDALRKQLLGFNPNLYTFYKKSSPTVERHNREYTPNEVCELLESTGFTIRNLYTKFVWNQIDYEIFGLLLKNNYPILYRGDCIFVDAVKVSPPKERYPSFLYDD